MDELIGPNLQIKLSVKEGRGFNNIIYPTIIVATINNHSLETNIFETDSNPQYATDLVWEVDKNTVRKMRSAQVPIKVECFIIKERDFKEKIGYLLISIRSAQIVTKNRKTTIKSSWNTLLGLKGDLKVCKPELMLSLTVEDQDRENAQLKEDLDMNSLFSKNGIEDKHLIRLGPPDLCRDIFLLHISTNMAANLDLLAKESVNFETSFTFWYRIFESDFQLKPFRSNDASSWMLNEKIVIKIESSLNILKNYLQTKPCMVVSLKNESNLIGRAEVDLHSLVPTENIKEFLRIAVNSSIVSDHHCLLSNGAKIDCEDHVRKPYVSLQLALQYVGLKNSPSSEMNPDRYVSSNNLLINKIGQETLQQNCNLLMQNHSEVGFHRNAGGDFKKFTTSDQCFCTSANLQKQSVNYEMIHHPQNLIHCCNEYSKSVEIYRYYSLDIQLNGIILNTFCPKIHHVEFRFHHPKTEIMSTFHPTMPILPGERMKLNNVGYKLNFISAADEIKKLLLTFPPKISICDVNEESKPCLAQTIVDLKCLFDHKSDCQYEAILMDSDKQNVGVLDVVINLQDHGPYYRKKNRVCDHLGPPILDDSLIYKIVDELETWKERQKEIFKSELRKKEERHLNLLSTEWQIRRDNLEAKFTSSVEQCKLLANTLNYASEDLKTKKLESIEKEAILNREKEELQCKYNYKFQEIKEAFFKTQEDLSLKVKHLEEQNRIIKMQQEPLKRENEKLQEIVNKQSEKLEIYEKGTLTQDQTALFLQELKSLEEKLSNAQKCKSFFKEQWGKSVREIHKMKIENQHAVELQIKNNKEELKYLNMENILNKDQGLPNDHVFLEHLQKEMNLIKSKSTSTENNTNDQIFAPINNTALKSNRNGLTSEWTTRSDEQEEKLRVLIEERDSLLKTGSYSIDDAVIVKLNTEIRSLLILG
ncbi:centrosomal protein of 120 kDa-like isoform X2 [Leptopilina heterotoma]|uniref:centrosomal protein of 120 kDa-like isoform X2 n=1 Tax=Leptopilina heterotoma TaxID=63436 RepID=UPI001CA85361|nr:centrosomal protein of 120 kDa-like isoform X2 [Leptopilina heterotoma]